MKKILANLAFGTILALGGFSLNLSTAEEIGTKDLPLPPLVEIAHAPSLDERSSAKALKDLKLANGALVFIRSTSSQSKALEEVTKTHWTHVGVLFNAQKTKAGWKLLPENSAKASWFVLEAGPVVRMTKLEQFVGQRAHAVLRLKQKITRSQEEALFSAGLSRLGKKYDLYFLLTRDGKTKDDEDYCSELVWYIYAKGLRIPLGSLVLIGSMDHSGSETQKLIKKRFSAKAAPLTFEEWKKQYVIPPQSQFDSPLMERIDL